MLGHFIVTFFLAFAREPIGIIDRLEKAGYVRRANDPKDRRRTIIEPVRNKKWERKIEAIFIPFHERMHKLLSSYSDGELAFLLDVLTKSIELTHEESKKLQTSLKRQPSRSILSINGSLTTRIIDR